MLFLQSCRVFLCLPFFFPLVSHLLHLPPRSEHYTSLATGSETFATSFGFFLFSSLFLIADSCSGHLFFPLSGKEGVSRCLLVDLLQNQSLSERLRLPSSHGASIQNCIYQKEREKKEEGAVQRERLSMSDGVANVPFTLCVCVCVNFEAPALEFWRDLVGQHSLCAALQ